MRTNPAYGFGTINKDVTEAQWLKEGSWAAGLTDAALRDELTTFLGPLPRGRRNSLTACPVALGVGVGCKVGDSRMTVDGSLMTDEFRAKLESWGLRFPMLALEFARRFDNGAYPDLELE